MLWKQQPIKLQVIFLLWALLPDQVLHGLGITYYPMKYWAVAFPVWLGTCYIFGTFIYWSINWIVTEPLDSYYTITDKHARASEVMSNDDDDDDEIQKEAIPPIGDIPIQVVNRLLYQEQSQHQFKSHQCNWKSTRLTIWLRESSLYSKSRKKTKMCRDHCCRRILALTHNPFFGPTGIWNWWVSQVVLEAISNSNLFINKLKTIFPSRRAKCWPFLFLFLFLFLVKEIVLISNWK